MDNFCGSTFWDQDLTWNTPNPIFTSCFLKTAAIWVPLGFFWVGAPIEAYLLAKSREQTIPWSLFNISKVVIVVLLMVSAAAEVTYNMIRYSREEDVYPVEYYTPFLLFVTLTAVLIFTLLGRKRGILSSGILSLFWLLLTLAAGISYYTIAQKAFNKVFEYDESLTTFNFIITVINFPLVLAEFFLSCFADKRKKLQSENKECPEAESSFLSKITFWWFNPMAVLGYKKALTINDMWLLSDENKAGILQALFDKYWLPLVDFCTGHLRKVKSVLSRQYSKQPVDTDHTVTSDSMDDYEKALKKLNIMTPILKAFKFELFITALLKLIASLVIFINPQLLDLLIAFVGSDEPYWKGLIYAAAMFFSAMLESFFNSQYEYRIYCIAMRIRSSITSVVYRKALSLSSSARRNFTVGEIVNLMSVDTQRVMDYVQMMNLLWSAPLQIGLAIYLLWQQLGISTVAGLIVMILMIPLNGVISYFVRNLQFRLMKDKDQRTKLMNEILNGIKVLKLYAWELSFQKKVMGIRNKEVKCLEDQAYLFGAITFAFSSAPFLVALASFATFVLISPDNILDANRAFVSLSLFNILRIPTAFLPMLITFTAMFIVSLRRINKYLQCEELDPNVISHDPSEEDPVVIENGTFSWTKDETPLLTDLDFRVKRGSLVAIVGQVGSGKSSLLSALLGDMQKWSGRVNVNGSVAYIPQQAWIQNATLKKNILFIKPYEEKKYKAVIEACALQPDLEILPGGDQTEIGEKGINLSGGQKQRISLARAVYDDSDIYYFDDPLSAVDAHVGKHIFEKVIGPTGMLKRKTRILVTHRISVLPEVDTIVVLKDGKITECGSYTELLNKKGAFAEFLIQYIQEEAEEVDSIPVDELQLIEEIAVTVGAPPELTRRFSVISDAISDSDADSQKRLRALSVTSQISVSEGMHRRRAKSIKETDDTASMKRGSIAEKNTTGTKLIEKEGVEVGSVKWWIYVKYMKSLGYWGSFWTITGYAAAYAFSLGSSIWLSAWSNDASDPANAANTKLRDLRLGVYGALGAGEVIFTLISSVSLNLACLRASKLLHDQMLSHILRAPMSFYDTTPMGRVLNRFTKDVDTADITIRFNLRMMLMMAFRSISSFLIISFETPIFLAVVLPLGILYYFMQKFYIPTSRQLKRLESVTRSPIYTHFSETITGSSSIRAYGASKMFIDHNNNLVDTNNSSYFPSLAASRWLSIRLEFLGYCIVLSAALFAVLLRESLSPGVAGLSVSYALQVTGVLNMLVRATADLETNIVAVERCLEYTNTPTEAEWFDEERKPNKSWPADGKILFEDYSTRYREGLDLVLKKINCEFDPGQRIGIVGRTGAGKSSLTLALFRIIEAANGNIIIDGLNIAEMGLHDLRSKLTIIPQDPVLFTGTLRMNLDPFDHYDDEAIWVALEQAHLKSYVVSLEKGLLHDVSEGGENLSVGQRQLVCLARALLRKTKVLILDEATAAVDVETDELIQTTIRSAFNDCTVLTIAHRLNTVMDYDRVMVLSNGEIKELDSPSALLQDDTTIFFSMAKDAGLV